jgi:hypothetical protein
VSAEDREQPATRPQVEEGSAAVEAAPAETTETRPQEEPVKLEPSGEESAEQQASTRASSAKAGPSRAAKPKAAPAKPRASAAKPAAKGTTKKKESE